VSKGSITSPYLQRANECNKILQSKVDADFEILLMEQDVLIHKSYFSFIKNHRIENSRYTNTHQQNMIKKLSVNGIKTYTDLVKEREKGGVSKIWLEVAQIYRMYPKTWRSIYNKAKKEQYEPSQDIPIKLNMWKTQEFIKTSDIRMRINKEDNNWNSKPYLEQRHCIEDLNLNNNPFETLIKATDETKLRNVQYKILHNIYPTMYHLHKWKIKSNPNCTHCNETETLSHAIYECEIAQSTLSNFVNIIKSVTNITLHLNLEDVMCGIQNDMKGKWSIDCLLILIKRNLILQREDKRTLNEDEIKKMIIGQIKNEKYIAIKQGKMKKYESRWHTGLRDMVSR